MSISALRDHVSPSPSLVGRAGRVGPVRTRARWLDRMDIAVVGAGASAVCLLTALADLDAPAGQITVFDAAALPWRGRPYGPDLPVVRLNSYPRDMSVHPGDDQHYARWLADQDQPIPVDPYAGVAFAPRSVYGRYLEESAAAAIGRLQERGWHVRHERARVVAALRTTDRVVLRTTTGRHHAADYVVLGVGMGEPGDGYGLRASPGFVADPYPLARSLDGVPTPASVGVLGSGLTAIDVVLGLLSVGHRGPVRLLSRTGVLPAVRQTPRDLTLQHFVPSTFETWRDQGERVDLPRIVALMRRELADAGADESVITAELAAIGTEDPQARLRRHLDAVDAPGPELRILQKAVPESGPQAWPLLSEADRAAFLARHYRSLMSLCCPMPPSTAAVLLGALESGQLRIDAGLRQVRPREKGGFDLDLSSGPARCDVVINAVSPASHRIPAAARDLIGSLVAGRTGTAHPHGGLHIDPATSRLTAGEEPDPRLYVLGGLATGSLLFTFGVMSLVDRSVDIARAMVSHAQARPTLRIPA